MAEYNTRWWGGVGEAWHGTAKGKHSVWQQAVGQRWGKAQGKVLGHTQGVWGSGSRTGTRNKAQHIQGMGVQWGPGRASLAQVLLGMSKVKVQVKAQGTHLGTGRHKNQEGGMIPKRVGRYVYKNKAQAQARCACKNGGTEKGRWGWGKAGRHVCTWAQGGKGWQVASSTHVVHMCAQGKAYTEEQGTTNPQSKENNTITRTRRQVSRQGWGIRTNGLWQGMVQNPIRGCRML